MNNKNKKSDKKTHPAAGKDLKDRLKNKGLITK